MLLMALPEAVRTRSVVDAPLQRPSCAGCVAIAGGLEKDMRAEWSHLRMHEGDRKRHLADEALQRQECDEAIATMLGGICRSVQHYSSGKAHGIRSAISHTPGLAVRDNTTKDPPQVLSRPEGPAR